MVIEETDRRWMELALDEAELAFAEGETPVGAVVVNQAAYLVTPKVK